MTPSELTLGPDIVFETHGNDRDLLENIHTASARISIMLDSELAQDFFTDLNNTSEGVFYLELRYDGTRIFLGRILGNGFQLEDRKQPFFTIEAIDGLTLLKNKEYTHSGSGYQSLIDILHHIISQIDVIENIYTSGDFILYIASNLQVNVPIAVTGNIWDIIRYDDYFYTFENDIRNPLTFWEVLEEMLQRHNLVLKYQNAIYIILGKELMLTGLDEVAIYTKGGFTATLPFEFIEVNVENSTDTTMMSGGTYYYEPAIKAITLIASKYHSTKNLADGIIWTRADTTYKKMGLMLEGEQYATHLRFSLQQQYTPAQTAMFTYIRVKFYFKATEWNGTDNVYPTAGFTAFDFGGSHFFMVFPNLQARELENETSEEEIIVVFRYATPMDYVMHFVFEEADMDRDMFFRIEFDGFLDDNFNPVTVFPPVSVELNWKITQEFGFYPNLKSDIIKFYGETDTLDVERKELNILASDTYGSLQGQPIIFNLATPEIRAQRPTNLWRFDSSDSYESLERAMLRILLRLVGVKQQYLSGQLNVKFIIPSPFMRLDYRGSLFNVSKISWNLYNCIMDFTGIRIPTVEPEITINLVAPNQDIFAPVFTLYEDVLTRVANNTTITQYDEYEVSGTTFNLDSTPFGLDFVFNKIAPLEESVIKAHFSCFKNGVKLQYYHFTNDPLEPNFYQFYLDQSTNDVVFGSELESDHIEFIFINKT